MWVEAFKEQFKPLLSYLSLFFTFINPSKGRVYQLVLYKLNGVLYLCRNKLSTEALKTVYYSLAYSHLSYCITIWGSTWKRFINQVILAQKRVIRTISYAGRYERSAPLFIQNKMLAYKYVHHYFCSLIIHKFMYSGYCSDIFQLYQIPRELRYNVNTVHVPLFRTTRGQQSILYRAPYIWNNLPNNLRSIGNIVTFKRSLKLFLQNNQIHDHEEI